MGILAKITKSDFYDNLKHSKNYLFVNIATMGLSIITIPIFTRLYSTEDYGIIALFTAYVGIIVPLLSLNSSSSISRYYYEQEDDMDEFIGTTLILTFSVVLSTLMVVIIFFSRIVKLFALLDIIVILLFANAILIIFNQIYMQILVPQKKSKEFATINIISAYLTTGLAIFLVISRDKEKYLGQIYAIIIIRFIISFYIIWKIVRLTKLKFVKSHFKYILAYSIPLLPYVLSSTILAQFDRIMIGKIENNSSVGIYSIGYAIASMLILIVAANQTAIGPDFFKFYQNQQYSRLDRLTVRIFSLTIIAGFGLILFVDEIFLILVDEKFHDGKEVVPIVVIGIIFFAMFNIYGRYIGYAKKTIYSSIIMLIAGITNVILNAIFIPEYSYIAAAYSTAISYFLLFFLAWIVAKYRLKSTVTPVYSVISQILVFIIALGFYLILSSMISNAVILIIIKIMLVFIISAYLYRAEILALLND